MKIAILLSGVPWVWLKRSVVTLQNRSLPVELNEILTSGRLVCESVDRVALVIMLPSMWVYCGL